MMVSPMLLVLLVAAGASAEVVKTTSCEGVVTDKCAVSEVRVVPCNNPKRCVFPRKQDVAVSIDFTPQFSTSNLKTQVIWGTTKWNDLDSDACKTTICPTAVGTIQTYNASMHISKYYPKGPYTFNWQIYDDNDPTNICCFSFSIRIRQ